MSIENRVKIIAYGLIYMRKYGKIRKKAEENSEMAVLTYNCKVGFVIKNSAYDKFIKEKTELPKETEKQNNDLLLSFSKQLNKDK